MLSHEQRMYDAYVTREPDYPDEPSPKHCDACGGFLPIQAERSEPWSDEEYCDGVIEDEYGAICGAFTGHVAHTFTFAAGVTEHRTCPKCGEVNIWVEV